MIKTNGSNSDLRQDLFLFSSRPIKRDEKWTRFPFQSANLNDRDEQNDESTRLMLANDTIEILKRINRKDPLFWNLPSPVDCGIVRFIGIGLCISACAGALLNGSLLFSFIRYKALRTPPNIFIMFISATGLLASCVNLPMSGSSSVFCRWLYSNVGCYTEGFVAFLNGCAGCFLLCAVSLSRCYIIVRPFNAKDVTVGYPNLR